jgi:hypothetical protein
MPWKWNKNGVFIAKLKGFKFKDLSQWVMIFIGKSTCRK